MKLMMMVGLFNWMVAFFLLVAASLLTHREVCYLQSFLCSFVAGLHGSLCLLPQLLFLSLGWCRLLVLTGTGILAYGIRNCRQILVFLLLELSLTLFATGAENGLSLTHIPLGILCFFSLFLLLPKGRKTVAFHLIYQGNIYAVTALEDTGNLLKDPVTGSSVLVIDPIAAQELTGLKPCQLRQPIKTLESGFVPGLRLIPYHTINTPTGFLLALKMEYRKGRKCYPILVAFAPEVLDQEGKIQGLIGGSL